MRKAQGLYIISVASQILEMHPQTLRKYERAGFVDPPRMGTLRLYSEEDIARLRLIKHFVEKLGLNLAGVELVLSLTSRLLQLRAGLASQEEAEPARRKALQEVDGILRDLGFRVVEAHADEAEEGPQALPLPGGWGSQPRGAPMGELQRERPKVGR